MLTELYGRKIDLGPSPSGLCVKRWTGQLSPEPETVAWIESLPKGGVFFDVGASVGTHAIRAVLRGLVVTAFEPQERCLNELVGIVSRNDLSMICSNLALSNICSPGVLAPGRSTHTFYPRTSNGSEPALSTTLDAYVKMTGCETPAYIKIDVDGNEPQIIQGGLQTLRHVKSALIEVDPLAQNGNADIPNMMKQLGFGWDQNQVDACMIREGKYKGTANWIFYR